MILHGMPRKRVRSLDGLGVESSPSYPGESSTTGVSDSGSLDAGVIPYKPSVTYVQQPGKPIAPLKEQPKTYAGEPAPAGQQYVPWVIRDKTGRIIKSGYRLAPVAREAVVRKEVEIKVAPQESPEDKAAKLAEQMKKSREDLALQRERQAKEWAQQVRVAEEERLKRRITNPDKLAKALHDLGRQHQAFVEQAEAQKQRAFAAEQPKTLASVIANVQRVYDAAVRDGAQAVRSSPGVAPLSGRELSSGFALPAEAPAWVKALTGPGTVSSPETAIQVQARKLGVTLKTGWDYRQVEQQMKTGLRPVSMAEIDAYAIRIGRPNEDRSVLEQMIRAQEH